MKQLKDFFRDRNAAGYVSAAAGDGRALDEKIIAKVFFDAIQEELGGLAGEGVKETFLKNGTLWIKVSHSTVGSELWLRREAIIKKINHIFKRNVVEEIRIASG